MPLHDQSPSLNTDFMMTAYGITWLGQAMPAWVTAQGALQPYVVDNGQVVGLVNQTWTAETTLYGTSLDCEAADARNESTGLSYSNSKGCTTNPGALDMDLKSEYGGLYIGYYLDQSSDYSLSGSGCPSAVNSHLFLALWGQSGYQHPEANTTAYFCEPNYWTQKVNATLMVPSLSVSEAIPLGPQLPLSDDMFNRSAFEYNIGTGAQPVSQRADISETTVFINQAANLASLGFNYTPTNMVGFALGLSRLGLEQYTDPHNLVSSFENAHKLLHALAIRQLMRPKIEDSEERPSIVNGKTNAIIVVRSLAIVIEVILGLVVSLTFALLIYSHSRTSQLCTDPASLKDIIRMVSKSGKLDGFTPNIYSRGTGIKHSLVNGKIVCLDSKPTDPDLNFDTFEDHKVAITSQMAKKHYAAKVVQEEHFVRPFEMSMSVATVFITLLFLSLGAAVALKILADKHDGLPLPSDNAVVNQLVLNYVPVIFATFLEPFWLLLNRLLCVLQPFEELRPGSARSSRSLDLKYTSLPPQLIFWRAFRAKHYTLSAVCVIGLSANLLAVSLSGLLNPTALLMEKGVTFTQRYQPLFSRVRRRSDIWDYEYVAKTNFSNEAILPPWIAADKFFVPITIDAEPEDDIVESFRARTQSFGIRAACERSEFNDTALITGQQKFFFTEQQTPSGKRILCGGLDTPRGGQNNSKAALEVFTQLQPVDFGQINPAMNTNEFVDANATEEERLTCNSILITGFLRANLTVTLDEMKTDRSNIGIQPSIQRINSLSSLWMMCRTKLASTPYEVAVDRSGHVQSYRPAGPEAKDLTTFFSNGTTMNSFLATTTSILSSGQDTGPYWHNDTFVDTWFAYFIKQLSNSSMSVDPVQPVPDFTHIAPHVEDLIARLFAIVLSLNQDWLAEADGGSKLTGTILIPTQRVFVSRPMFIVTIVLVALNVIVATTYWIRRPKRMLATMPYTIASILAMTRASGLISEVENKKEWESDWRFGYGRFVGTDGRPHIGIERSPFVVPLES
ncbi:MAG: hypothetical protein Q9225_002481 [Loekoesia sp. 1 TL-2023]